MITSLNTANKKKVRICEHSAVNATDLKVAAVLSSDACKPLRSVLITKHYFFTEL
jgi:hypothetical protein